MIDLVDDFGGGGGGVGWGGVFIGWGGVVMGGMWPKEGGVGAAAPHGIFFIFIFGAKSVASCSPCHGHGGPHG